MSRHHYQQLDLYCCLPHEFLIAYPQPQLSFNHKKKKIYRNTNATEPTASLQLSKCKSKNLLHTSRRRRTNRIMSIESSDHEVEFYMAKESTKPARHHRHSSQMADGDKKTEKTLENFIEQFQQQRFINNQEHIIDMIRPVPCKPTLNDQLKQASNLKSSISHLSSSLSYQPTLSLNRTSTWRKLQADITPSHYNHIQKFQRERRKNSLLSVPHPIMLSPLNKQSEFENSKNSKVISNIINSCTSLSIDSTTSLTDSNSNHRIIQSINNDDNSNKNQVKLLKNDSFTNISVQNSPNTPSLQEREEFQQPKRTHSLFESIEELCILIRKLLQHELTEQKITLLQATIANQLAILLTYLAIPNNEKIISESITKDTTERMTSTDEDNVSSQKPLLLTTGTQTDLESTLISKSSSSSHKVTSHTELMSTSVTLHLPGRRLNHTLSDTFIYHIHHQQQYSSSHHKLISFSETIIHSLMNHWSTKEKTKHLLKHIGQKFQHYIELESSNTCLEGSTEFTPDFILTTINNSKYDDDDQTEQFGIDTISLIINKNQEKIDTLTFNSTEKENYDSLELDIEHDNESNIEEDDIPKNSITEANSLFLNNTISTSLNNNLVSPIMNQLNNKKHFYQLFESLLNTSQWQLPILPRKSKSIDLIYEKQTAKIDFKHTKIRSNSNSGINMIGKRVRIKSNPSSRASTPTIEPHQEQLRKLSTLNYNNNYNEHVSDEFILYSSLPNIHQNRDSLVKTASLSAINSTNWSEVTDKLLHMYIRQFLVGFDARIRIDRKERKNCKKKYKKVTP